jgi:branched-chain amino acid transport system substrate-binding protein
MNLRIPLTFFLSFIFINLSSQHTQPIKIGLLIQDKTSLAAKQGAELAVKLANKQKGGNSRPFQLITKSMEGPWGTGAKQAIDLIFENEVWALLGSHDGRNAHLVEQAATKSTVVFVSAWSSDPTLSQAFVPWFFNCVPNDRQQAGGFIEEIFNKRKFTRVATIADNSYDSNLALKNFIDNLKLAGNHEPAQFLFDNYVTELDDLSDQISKSNADCIVLFCQPSASLSIIRLLRQKRINLPVFGSLSILNENVLSESELSEFDAGMSVPCGSWSKSAYMAFHEEYQKNYGKMPGMVASYAFDGMNILIEAIRTSGGPEKERIQEALSKMQYAGVTGRIQFDSKGNRSGSVVPENTKNGVPVTVSY